MGTDDLPVEDLLRGLDIPPFDTEEFDGAAVADAFVIVRYQRPDWDHPRASYACSRSMSPEMQVGLLTMVLDRVRDVQRQGWVDGE
jgi:hypothetical protein